jgi:hypothetical protein
MGKIGKEEIMAMFEKQLDEIMSEDKSKIFDISQIIKTKVFDIGNTILENWTSEKIASGNSNNTITQYDETLKKK